MNQIVQNNYLNKSGFYLIDDTSPRVIDVLPGVSVKLLLINNKKPITLNLESGAKVDFYAFLYESTPPKMFFHQNEEHSSLSIHALFYNKMVSLQSQLKSYIHAHHCSSHIQIVGIIEKERLQLDSIIEIEKDVHQVQAHLEIENIFIGDEWSVSSIPTLLVRSDDVVASHSSKTHRLEKEKLFYLMARGLSQNHAVSLMIDGYFQNKFSQIKDFDKHIFQDLYDTFFTLRS